MARNLKQIISPLLISASKDIISAAKATTPMSGIPEQHRKLEGKRKKSATAELTQSSKTNMSVELKMIEQFVKLDRLAEKDEDDITPRKKNKKRKASQKYLLTRMTMTTTMTLIFHSQWMLIVGNTLNQRPLTFLLPTL